MGCSFQNQMVKGTDEIQMLECTKKKLSQSKQSLTSLSEFAFEMEVDFHGFQSSFIPSNSTPIIPPADHTLSDDVPVCVGSLMSEFKAAMAGLGKAKPPQQQIQTNPSFSNSPIVTRNLAHQNCKKC